MTLWKLLCRAKFGALVAARVVLVIGAVFLAVTLSATICYASVRYNASTREWTLESGVAQRGGAATQICLSDTTCLGKNLTVARLVFMRLAKKKPKMFAKKTRNYDLAMQSFAFQKLCGFYFGTITSRGVTKQLRAILLRDSSMTRLGT